ncbi:hypothetical protein AB0M80_43590 [Amycolatopsis sp. NPDC051045]|uniref:hypothetical protein n=1 Tax=Amycolatopsis sp. NPDC051045 TaxID=3156922 RepID=UPI00342D13FB
MDKSTLRHRLALSWRDEVRFEAFVRSDDGNVEHYWASEDGSVGPEDLGGSFDTDPVAVGNHLIGRSGNQLVDWVWDSHTEPQLLGTPRVVVLPGLCATQPEVIATQGRLDVFAPSLDGPMRHWFLLSADEGWQGPEVLTEDVADIFTQPCAVSRAAGTFDVFTIDNQNHGLRHWFNDAKGWHCERRTRGAAGENLTGRPTALWSTDKRADVFALRSDGVPIHWGFDGRTWFADEIRLRDTALQVPTELTLVSVRPKQLTLLARGAGPNTGQNTAAWNLDPSPPGDWREQGFEGSPFPWALTAHDSSVQLPDGRVEEQGLMNALTRESDGSFTNRWFTLTAEHSIDGFAGWELTAEIRLIPEDPVVAPPGPFTPAVVEVEMLARRPEDLVLMGVRWNDAFDVVAGSPGELVAQAGAELAVTLSPQHYAEEVVPADGDGQPSLGSSTGGVPVWQSSPSGPSRVVVTLDEETRVALTVEGVLDALRTGRLVPAANLTEAGTQLELPCRLLMTPFRPDGGAIGLDHASEVVSGPGGTVGLWNSRIAAEGSEPTAPAGLTLRPLGVDVRDPFDTSLSGASRARILAEEPTARIDRLRLSSLGGSLTAKGVWPTFEWDHVASLGRDHYVRTAMKGVLYPWGNPAVYVETSERRLDTTAAGSVAHLRKRSVLIVTEPVHDLAPSRAFPFTQVRLQRTLLELGGDPGFVSRDFPPPAAEGLREQRAFLVAVADGMLPDLHGVDGFTPGEPVVEDLAFFDGLTDPATAEVARKYVDTGVAIMKVDDTLAALEFGGTAPVGIYFVPGGETTPITFPALLHGPSGDVQVDLPVVFFADVRMPAGLMHPAYRSFEDTEKLAEVADAWVRMGDGDTPINPLRLDMVGAAEPRPADQPEVRRLHIVGEQRDGGFVPRLGSAPLPGEAVPPADRWAFEMAMSELSALVGHQGPGGAPTLKVALSPELLGGSADPGLLFLAPAGTDALKMSFSRNCARSGGLAAPDLVIDGVSRSDGPVQAASFVEQVISGHPDPLKFLDSEASLLGFSLADLIDSAEIEGAPKILSDPTPGRPPEVTMSWPKVPLKTTKGAFVTKATSALALEVTLAPDHQRVECTVTDVILAFPDRNDPPKLLEVSLGTVKFLQEGGGVPSISVEDVTTTFFGFLKLLEKLQNAVDFSGGAPGIEASDAGVTATFDLPVPDVTTGGFQLTGLSFHGVIDVPFDKRPVTIGLAFASREDPFNVSILALGGGGYVDILLDSDGLRRLEIALEFGASLEVDFFVAIGEVHAMGGIRVVEDNGLSFAGYLRLGGMVEVLGLVSVSIELVVTLTYEDTEDHPNSMVGRATLVLEIDLLLFSDSVELDSGPWVLAGDSPASQPLPAPPPGGGPELGPAFAPGRTTTRDPFLGVGRATGPVVDPGAWRAYRDAFDAEAMDGAQA